MGNRIAAPILLARKRNQTGLEWPDISATATDIGLPYLMQNHDRTLKKRGK